VDLLQAIILGIVQGLTEFIPVSSSGHLVLVPAFFGWDDQGLAFDVGLHVGTMVAVIGYFWRDWWRMSTSGLRDLGNGALLRREPARDTQMLLLLALGTVPAGIVALLFDDWIEANLREPWLVAIALIVAGTVMLIAERIGRMERTVDSIRLRDVVVIGVAQACAPRFRQVSSRAYAGKMRLVSHSCSERQPLRGRPCLKCSTLVAQIPRICWLWP
jgi:undecaprenyl-diphosphatase